MHYIEGLLQWTPPHTLQGFTTAFFISTFPWICEHPSIFRFNRVPLRLCTSPIIESAVKLLQPVTSRDLRFLQLHAIDLIALSAKLDQHISDSCFNSLQCWVIAIIASSVNLSFAPRSRLYNWEQLQAMNLIPLSVIFSPLLLSF